MKKIVNKFFLAGDKFMHELHRACFQHDMGYEDFKDLAKRTDSDKVLRDKTLNISKIPKYGGYQRRLASMVYNFFDKKSASGSCVVNNEIKQNLELAEKLHKPIIRKLKKKKKFIQNLKTIFRVLI